MSLSEKFEVIYPGDEVTRIQIFQKSNGELSVVVDVHGMKCRQAERFINNLINIARCRFVMTVIHGYNHGTAILEMVRNELDNRHIVNRYTDNYNRGVTYLAIA